MAMKPGDLAQGLVPMYVNLVDVAALEDDNMLRIVFGAKTGPEAIARVAVVMNEERAEALANGMLQVIAERRRLTWAKAVPKPETS